jgi:hypothetical protein
VVDIYKSFRSEALALTVRITTVAACSTLHVNTMRWLLGFSNKFGADPDPINRYVGTVHANGTRTKQLNARTSVSKHIKVIDVMLASKNLEVDCFHVGEHRAFTADSAEAKAVVLAFCGDTLRVDVRIQRKPQPLAAQPLAGNALPNQEVEFEDLEDATGDWDFVDTTLSLRNLFVFAQPPLSGDMLPGHPLFSAGLVRMKSGESLVAELLHQNHSDSCRTRATDKVSKQIDPLSPTNDPLSPTNDPLSPTTERMQSITTDDAHFHALLLRQSSIAHRRSIDIPDDNASLRSEYTMSIASHGSSALPHGIAWDYDTLKSIVDELRVGELIHDHSYKFRVYRSIFLGSQFVDWALNETPCSTRLHAVTLGQVLLESGFIRSVPTAPKFVDGPAFYRVRTQDLSSSNAAATEADTVTRAWSKAYGNLRADRVTEKQKTAAAATASHAVMRAKPEMYGHFPEASQEKDQGPAWKLMMKDLYLQWTAETREVLHDWEVLLTLATRMHPRPKHAKVVIEPPLSPAKGGSTPEGSQMKAVGAMQVPSRPALQRSGPSGQFLREPISRDESTVEMSPKLQKQRVSMMLNATEDDEAEFLFDEVETSTHALSWSTRKYFSEDVLPQDDAPSLGRKDEGGGQERAMEVSSSLSRIEARKAMATKQAPVLDLVQHLLQTAEDPEASTISVSQQEASLRGNELEASTLRSESPRAEVSSFVRAAEEGEVCNSRPAVQWLIELLSVQLGVETKEQPGVETKEQEISAGVER